MPTRLAWWKAASSLLAGVAEAVVAVAPESKHRRHRIGRPFVIITARTLHMTVALTIATTMIAVTMAAQLLLLQSWTSAWMQRWPSCDHRAFIPSYAS